MNPQLLAFLKKHTAFDEDVLEEMMNAMQVETYKKGALLLSQGDVSSKCYVVLEGCIRQYTIGEDGKETTNNFFTEEQTVTLFISYKKRVPSDYFLSCAEDSILLVGDFETEENMYLKYPELEKITRAMLEFSMGETQEEIALFMSSTPEQRYLRLVEKRPSLISRVPQHQLASYLGMTPESLSRIKKRIAKDMVLTFQKFTTSSDRPSG